MIAGLSTIGIVGPIKRNNFKSRYTISGISGTTTPLIVKSAVSQGSTTPTLIISNASNARLMYVLNDRVVVGPDMTLDLPTSTDGAGATGRNGIYSSYGGMIFRSGNSGNMLLSAGLLQIAGGVTNNTIQCFDRGGSLTVNVIDHYGASNTAGANLNYCAGRGTGTGNGGSHVFQVTIPGASGGTFGTLTTVMTISGADGGLKLTCPSATSVPFTITGAASQSANLINVTSSGGSAGGLLAFTAAGRLNIGGTTIDSLGRHINVVSTTPGIGLYESDVTTDEKGWDMAASASTFSFRCFNDALNAASNIFTITRSGYVPNHMKIFPALEVSSYHYTTYTNNGNSGAAKTIDWSASPVQRITLDASCTLTFTAPNGISDVLLHITQNGTGGYSVTWPASVKWSGGTAPTITTTAGAVSVVRLFYDGATYWGDYTLDVR